MKVLHKLFQSIFAALGFALDLTRLSTCCDDCNVSGRRTVPSDALVTNPVTPMLLACLQV